MSAVPRSLFVAGATGLTGRALLTLAEARQIPTVAHARPSAKNRADASLTCCDLADEAATRTAIGECTTVIQLIGTMRSRFGSGDSYESSDIGTTRQLVAAAKGTQVDHVVLLSSALAGFAVGAYLRAKREAERVVQGSGIPFTILRPGAFVSEERRETAAFRPFLRWMEGTALAPVRTEDLAAAILDVAARRDPLDAVLEGGSFWTAVRRAR